MTTTDSETLDSWAIVEMMGHVRRAGRLREVELAGAGFLRLDIPTNTGGWTTQLIAPAAIYAITPTTEEIARAAARSGQPEPVHRWELPFAVADDSDDGGHADSTVGGVYSGSDDDAREQWDG